MVQEREYTVTVWPTTFTVSCHNLSNIVPRNVSNCTDNGLFYTCARTVLAMIDSSLEILSGKDDMKGRGRVLSSFAANQICDEVDARTMLETPEANSI